MPAEGGPDHVTVVAHDVGNVGGMERQLAELIGGMLGRGISVTVISRTLGVAPRPGLRWVRVPGPARPFVIAYPWFFLAGSLLTRLRRRGVLHTTGAIVFNKADICTVHFCHQALAELPKISRVSRDTALHRLNALFAAPMSRFAERRLYSRGRVGRLAGVSRGVERELRTHFPTMSDRISVVPNGVDTSSFSPPDAVRGRGETLEAVFVGSEWERKGLRIAIEAVGQVPEVQLTVVGEGDADLFRKLAEDLGAAERVEFAGSTAAVVDRYRAADVFVLPTAYETFSLVTYEAAACGLPLLVTRVNGVEDLLRDGHNGWFLERDADDLSDRLRELIDDPDLRIAMGSQARQDSLHFDWARMVDSYVACYRGRDPDHLDTATATRSGVPV